MKLSRLVLTSAVCVVLLTPYCGVEACGPFFEPEVFVRMNRPDDLQGFARGQLGILQSGFDSNEYAVAYRYLMGGKLSARELAVYALQPREPDDATGGDEPASAARFKAWQERIRADNEASAPNQWLKARQMFVPPEEARDHAPTFQPDPNSGVVYFDPNYLHCPNFAFTAAVTTLNTRAAAWGAKSPWLKDWIYAQDDVFSYCGGNGGRMPAAVSAGAPALLKSDRAYQTAAATLYAKQFDEAAKLFLAIATDKSSPWQPWGAYLAARATVRKAFAMGKPTDPYSGDLATFDAATMQQAQKMLEAIHPRADVGPTRAAIQAELNFVRLRTEPEKRVAEICGALAGPAPDANFRQDLDDLSFVLMKHMEGKNPPPLLAWIAAWRGGSAADAYARWQQTHELPWLVLALAKAGPADSFAEELVGEAAKIGPGAPAYDTAFYHRVRLLIALKRTDEARTQVDGVLQAIAVPNSTRNALRAERMATARSFPELLAYAPRTIMERGSEEWGLLIDACNAEAKKNHTKPVCSAFTQLPGFDNDFVAVFNQKIPLDLWIEAAQSRLLPANLRQDIAVAAWVRAVILDDAGSAAKLAPLLPKAMGVTATGATGFPAVLTILRNPGAQPYLEAGISRVASYSTFSEFRNNWWGAQWQSPYREDGTRTKSPPPPAFLTPAQTAAADAEVKRVAGGKSASVQLGQRVLDYAQAHPGDRDVPEALALVVRVTHYGGETGSKENSAISKAAFQLLHQRYPQTSWAKNTKFYY